MVSLLSMWFVAGNSPSTALSSVADAYWSFLWPSTEGSLQTTNFKSMNVNLQWCIHLQYNSYDYFTIFYSSGSFGVCLTIFGCSEYDYQYTTYNSWSFSVLLLIYLCRTPQQRMWLIGISSEPMWVMTISRKLKGERPCIRSARHTLCTMRRWATVRDSHSWLPLYYCKWVYQLSTKWLLMIIWLSYNYMYVSYIYTDLIKVIQFLFLFS